MRNMVFLDLDGVLADSQQHALHHFGIRTPWPIGEPSTVEMLNKHRIKHNFHTNNDLWDAFDHDFWASIPLTFEAHTLILWALNSVGEENVYISTSPTTHPGCFSGKWAWIQKNLPYWLHNQVFIGKHKGVLAGTGHLLIDDIFHNVNDFHGMGGTGFLVKRPWNGSQSYSKEELLDRLDDAAELTFEY